MATIEHVIKIEAKTKTEYERKLNKEIKELKKHGLDYEIFESKYSYIAEIVYWFDISESYYEYYC
jgi:hypothetical protein